MLCYMFSVFCNHGEELMTTNETISVTVELSQISVDAHVFSKTLVYMFLTSVAFQ